ncbi:hypothetical protein TrVE_jg10445 [Triparma verrucosa]|uniref:Peptidase M41 domain-containing protein n=1 Tax=Triparma verrucosa TaxID=1606542 RepID=A0A9W7CKN6_9STRA|nr:hypothetical protein TrVE_jg10445 [Triparma verrucosa]
MPAAAWWWRQSARRLWRRRRNFPSPPQDEANLYACNPYSDATRQAMDEQAKVMVDESYTRTLELLEGKKEELVKVAQLLMEKETINHDNIVDLIGARPFEGDKTYEGYIKNKFHGLKSRRKRRKASRRRRKRKRRRGGSVDGARHPI